MSGTSAVVWHELGTDRLEEFMARGHRQRHVFPHRLLYLPKSGPDGYKLAGRMCGIADPALMWELVLYADASLLEEFPEELFFDDDLVWHQQQFGLTGQIATANVVLDRPVLWSMVHIADVVQRIGRRRELKTRIDNRFRGWHDMLLNAVLAFALERGAEEIRLPTASLAMRHTDRRRTVGAELFERVYDRDVRRLFDVERAGDWWVLDVRANRDRAVLPRIEKVVRRPAAKTICVCHDVEAGLGHVGIDEDLVRLAGRTWRRSLRAMLAIEREFGVRATYNVVGLLLEDVREGIAAGDHTLAFHSYDHTEADQLARCRRVDYRLKGYRPPRSRITPELDDRSLLYHNFEWLASSALSLRATEPVLRNGLVRIPIHFDDFPLYRHGVDFAAWQERIVAEIEGHELVVLSLHDCYAHLWIDRYPELLERVRALGQLKTLDELAAAAVLAASE